MTRVDCISRQAVIDSLYDWSNHSMTDAETWHLRQVIGDIKSMPSVTPQEPIWIPVEEKLPEDGQNVLFCDIDNDIMVGYHVKGRPNTHFSQDGTYEDMKNVRAWMPLPKPYEPQESEDA